MKICVTAKTGTAINMPKIPRISPKASANTTKWDGLDVMTLNFGVKNYFQSIE